MKNKVIDTYNNLVDYINTLIDNGYIVDDKSNDTEGYGFYIETKNKHYIEISIWSDETMIDLLRHNSNFCHDIANDVLVERSKIEGNNIVDIIHQIEHYLVYANRLDAMYNIQLTKEEINELVEATKNPALANKLLKVLHKES